MHLNDSIETIERLLKEDSQASLTYAALECRLAIERICYERLRVVHDYIAPEDLKKWQPHHVIRVLIDQVDPSVTKSFTLSISKDPLPDGSTTTTLEEFKSIDYIPVGTQTGFDPKKIGGLWHALSREALHLSLPSNSGDTIRQYGDSDQIRAKVLETLQEIRRIHKGSLISSGLGGEVSFQCFCGVRNKRKASLLKDGQTVSCISPNCSESYTYTEDDSSFGRRSLLIVCRKCEYKVDIPRGLVEKLRTDQRIYFDCDCGETISIEWRPMQGQRTRMNPAHNNPD